MAIRCAVNPLSGTKQVRNSDHATEKVCTFFCLEIPVAINSKSGINKKGTERLLFWSKFYSFLTPFFFSNLYSLSIELFLLFKVTSYTRNRYIQVTSYTRNRYFLSNSWGTVAWYFFGKVSCNCGKVLKYRSVTDTVQPIREIVQRIE
jgi:hypothetical protein